MKPPIFLLGSPRSGTTLFRLMLTSHPAIVVPPECGFAIWWAGKYGDWEADDPRVSAFVRDLANSRKIETWQLDFTIIEAAISKRRPANYAELVSLVYESYADRLGRTFECWGDKNNFHVRHVPELRAIFPEARFVHIVRDGRDVACSYRELNARSIDSPYAPKLPREIPDIALEWSDNVEAVRSALAGMPRAQWHECRYEDLVRSPEQTLRAICAFLALPFEPQMLGYHEANARSQLEPAEFLQWKAKTVQPPDLSSVGRYARDLSRQEIAAFEQIAADTLRTYHYDVATTAQL